MEIHAELSRCVSSLDWVKSATIADIPGEPCLLVHTAYRPDGRELSYYVRFDGAEGIGTAFSILESELPNPSNPTADVVDRLMAELAALNGIERLRYEALCFNRPVMRFALPGIGRMDLEIETRTDVRKAIRAERNAAQGRASRRHLSLMSLFGIATIARDPHDARVLVETAMAGGMVNGYRGMEVVEVPSRDTLSFKIVHGALEINHDEIRLTGVPDTVGSGITGRGSQGRPLSTLIDHPVMRLLQVGRAEWEDDVVTIVPRAWNGRRMSTAMSNGRAKDTIEEIVQAAQMTTA